MKGGNKLADVSVEALQKVKSALTIFQSDISELYNNSYAQAVRDNGEAAADAALRQATTRIAENGEIIRDFPGAATA